MTAATNAYNDDDDDRCCNCPSIDNDNSTIDPTPLLHGEEFYKDFQHFIHSISTPTALTKETHSDIVPAGSVDATSNPPADAKPEYTIFIKELHALHNELTILLLPSTSPPCIIEDQPTLMTVLP